MKNSKTKETNEKPIKNKKRHPDEPERKKTSGSARSKETAAQDKERFDAQPSKKKKESASKSSSDKPKRKKSSQDIKGKAGKSKSRKKTDSFRINYDKDYGDEFFTDELELKRKRARQKLEESHMPDIDIEKMPMSHKKRKLKNIGVAASIISIILVIGIVLSLTVFFRSEQFTVEGADHYSAQDVIDASGMKLGENLFLCDKSAGEQRIESSLPYIEEAKISIKIPNTMVITVTESKPAFIFKNGSEYIIVSSQGKVMEKVQGSAEKYDAPTVIGCTVKSAELGQEISFKESGILSILKAVAEGIDENEFSGIKEIDITNTARVCLNYSNRIKIILGIPEDIGYKLKTAKIIISDKLSETDAGELDVSSCKGESKASYFKSDPSIYLDKRTQQTQPVTEPVTAAAETQTQAESTADTSSDDYSSGVPEYEYPTDEYGNIIYSTDPEPDNTLDGDGDAYSNDYDNGYDYGGDYGYGGDGEDLYGAGDYQ